MLTPDIIINKNQGIYEILSLFSSKVQKEQGYSFVRIVFVQEQKLLQSSIIISPSIAYYLNG